MNYPTFTELFAKGAERLLLSAQEADEALLKLTESEGWNVLCLGVSCRRQVLLQQLQDYNPYTDPQEIAQRQAELKALDYIMEDFHDEVDAFYVDVINEKKKKEKKEKESKDEELSTSIPQYL